MGIVKTFHLTSPLPLGEIKTKIVSYIASKKGRLESSTEYKIAWSSGSAVKIRLLGGMAVSQSSLPVQVELIFAESSDNTKVEINITDTLGFGIRAGIKNKYEQYFTSLYSEIMALLA